MAIKCDIYDLIVRKKTLEDKYPGGVEQYRRNYSMGAYVEDEHLIQIAFMGAEGIGSIIEALEANGFFYCELDTKSEIALLGIYGLQITYCDWLTIEVINDWRYCWLVGTERGELKSWKDSLKKEREAIENGLDKDDYFLAMYDDNVASLPSPIPDNYFERFVKAQSGVYEVALSELKSGQKQSHWMWFIFPQIKGLGSSVTSKHYAIESLEVARAYLVHEVLGQRLLACTKAILEIDDRSALHILGYPDDLKLNSSMTLFYHATTDNVIFAQVIQKYFNGQRDQTTERLLGVI